MLQWSGVSQTGGSARQFRIMLPSASLVFSMPFATVLVTYPASGATKSSDEGDKFFTFASAHSVLLRQNFKFFMASINRDDLTAFGALITAGKVTPVIDRRYALSGTADAMAYAETGHARAKVIITFE